MTRPRSWPRALPRRGGRSPPGGERDDPPPGRRGAEPLADSDGRTQSHWEARREGSRVLVTAGGWRPRGGGGNGSSPSKQEGRKREPSWRGGRGWELRQAPCATPP